MEKRRTLFDEFPPVSKKEWMDKINSDLNGVDFDSKLVWKTNEGFKVQPFYRKEDITHLSHIGVFPELLAGKNDGSTNQGATFIKNGNSWLIRQNITVTDYLSANRKARSLLHKGINSLGFKIDDQESITKDNFNNLLTDLNPDNLEINFSAFGKAEEIVVILADIIENRGLSPSAIRGAVETDPLGRLLINGTLCIPVEAGLDYLASLSRKANVLPHFRTVQVNGSNFSNAGSNTVEELAFSISTGVEYISQLTDRGIDAEQAASKIRFSFGTGSGYFMEIAKLRAARFLWSLISEGFKSADAESFRMEIHSTTSLWNATVFDPYVNMLRTQTEAMSAVLGGTDSLTVNFYDIAFARPNEFSERIARNQQLMLKEEAHFDKVNDPASGSYYIENLTALVAEYAWRLFLEIEDKGGFLEALKSGFIQEKISMSSRKRMKNIATREEILLGTNLYLNPEENNIREEYGDILFSEPKDHRDDLVVKPVTIIRAAEGYEKIRLAVNKAVKRPRVFLLPVGDKVMRKVRSQFSAGFFSCAGYMITENDGFDSVDEGVSKALDSGVDIVVICCSDDEYPVYAPEIYRSLKEKAIIVIAGNRGNKEELRSLGIDNYICAGSDIIDSLNFYNSLLGIK